MLPQRQVGFDVGVRVWRILFVDLRLEDYYYIDY